MMKKLLIEFEADWVLLHREDDCLPVDAICKALEGMTEIKVEGNSLTDIFVVFDEQTVQAEELQKKNKGNHCKQISAGRLKRRFQI